MRLNVNVREAHSTLLEVLSEQHEQHQDLFNSNRLTFSEALAKLYQRLNPQIDMGQRTPQTIGEELWITVTTRKWKWRLTVVQTAGSVRSPVHSLPVKLSVPGCRFW